MTHIDLKTLPRAHPLRNSPLAHIQAEYKQRNTAIWKLVTPAYRIGNCTFNQLGPVWTDTDEWRIPCPPSNPATASDMSNESSTTTTTKTASDSTPQAQSSEPANLTLA